MARIIYAEDDNIMSEIVRDTLATAGHVVGVVEDGKSALQAISIKQPELIILDCSIPEMSGMEVLRAIRLHRDFCHTPVLMLTARHSQKDMQLAAFAGADAYIKKPFDPEYLIFLADSLLQQGRSGGNMAH
ncbi:response regulator transcription factor [Parasphingorhabdus cellanae]|uniref:Response regulator n=1 Tax=Parasphingorhabdus cellanae TaxID=2806553 RepID=A0ABX7T5M6_9SPHN|nr:response regulator [Parasphingorhabdus cellanae]QTD56223.1 response regulator [Parasphingorhabdus cellanae]